MGIGVHTKNIHKQSRAFILTAGNMTATLPLFWHLSSATKGERIDASVKLVNALEQLQEEFVPKELISSGSDVEQDDEAAAPKKDFLDVLNAQDMSYSIKRLVRGLASPRESSRLGFAVALTEVRMPYQLHRSF